MIRKLLNSVISQVVTTSPEDRERALYQAFLRHEARVGGTLFGVVAEGHKREFFCLDEHTWVWHEEWIDAAGERHIVATRYDIRPDGVLKSQNGSHYQKATNDEVKRLYQAALLYRDNVKKEVYKLA